MLISKHPVRLYSPRKLHLVAIREHCLRNLQCTECESWTTTVWFSVTAATSYCIRNIIRFGDDDRPPESMHIYISPTLGKVKELPHVSRACLLSLIHDFLTRWSLPLSLPLLSALTPFLLSSQLLEKVKKLSVLWYFHVATFWKWQNTIDVLGIFTFSVPNKTQQCTITIKLFDGLKIFEQIDETSRVSTFGLFAIFLVLLPSFHPPSLPLPLSLPLKTLPFKYFLKIKTTTWLCYVSGSCLEHSNWKCQTHLMCFEIFKRLQRLTFKRKEGEREREAGRGARRQGRRESSFYKGSS